ncbi:Wadjet anti-phage system protein JetD domain-containing protein [Thiomonas sp.]|uniref:Wadjet anti-phage system protein JetD domain-containing protein n=1 Tax=Thiomonas sp. TaxID=2047785 RepID=UPI0026393631|nr:Wadjet anti-phage system protein JetD domain-containing protein [Thiomonas sp.]
MSQDSAHALAETALARLLKAANRRDAGVGQRAALTGSALAEYRALRSLQDKEAFDAVLERAQACGAVRLTRPRGDASGFIERVDLLDTERLADMLGQPTHASLVAQAADMLQPCVQVFPALEDVLARWAALKTVRGDGPQHAAAWFDACRTIAYCREQGERDIPVRDASAQLFKDSKRIEALVPELDVLLAGDAAAPQRPDTQVLQEIGLFREPQPVRMAARLVVRRERVSALLDSPYGAFPPDTVLSLDGSPSRVLTIENQTTFHVQARRVCDSDVLCIYTAGMPSPAWGAMYQRLLASTPPGVPVSHWGDVDEGGFRIAAFVSRLAAAAGHRLEPWNMRPSDVPQSQRRPAASRTLKRMAKFARDAGWAELAGEIEQAGIVAEQEG